MPRHIRRSPSRSRRHKMRGGEATGVPKGVTEGMPEPPMPGGASAAIAGLMNKLPGGGAAGGTGVMSQTGGRRRRGSKRRSGSKRHSRRSKKGGNGVIATAAVPFGLLALQRYFKGSRTSKKGMRNMGNSFKRTFRRRH